MSRPRYIHQLQLFSGQRVTPGKVPARTLSVAKAAYIAGLMDGEGSITVQRGKQANRSPQHTPRIEITNTDLGLITWVKQITGVGAIAANPPSKDKRGIIRSTKPCYYWIVVSAPHIISILTQIVLYMRIKQGKARAAIALCQLIRPQTGKGAKSRLSDGAIAQRELLADLIAVRKYVS